jgi:hypothetical protein
MSGFTISINKTENSQNNSFPFAIKTRNFLVQKCASCNKDMELVEGVIIYGHEWYHGDCWNSIKMENKHEV